MTVIGRGRQMLRRLVFGAPPKNAQELGYVVMGRHTYTVPTVHRYGGDSAVVRIGPFTSMAKEVEFLPGGSHRTDLVSTFPIRGILLGAAPGIDNVRDTDVHVGSDVYIGRGARIVGPVTIGHGAVVAAYSVVARDVPPYAVVAGTPAVIKRFRFDPETIAALLEIGWWDWPDELIRARASQLMSGDVIGFVKSYG